MKAPPLARKFCRPNSRLSWTCFLLASSLITIPSSADDDTSAITGATKAVQSAVPTPPDVKKTEGLLNTFTVTFAIPERPDPGKPTPPSLAKGADSGASAARAIAAEYLRELKMAEAYRQIANDELAAVASAPNSAKARDLLLDAESKIAQARTMERRVMDDLHPSPVVSGTSYAPLSLRQVRQGSAMAQLLHAVQSGEQAEGRTGWYEASSISSTDASAYNSETESLSVVPGGGEISVRYLAATFASKHGRGQPLFESVRDPAAGGSTAVRLTPSAAADIRSARVPGAEQKVGGVALQVTLDLLGFLELPDFRKPGPATLVEHPVLISLRQLAKTARPHVNDWEHLPAAVRYPGNMDRVIGFVIDQAGDDVMLLGIPTRPGGPRIDIDSFIIALQSVWKNGNTPLVSLDPLPQEPGGPQFSRIRGVPANSGFARIMLDADYAMKRIMSGNLKTQAPGYQSPPRLWQAAPFTGVFAQRYWFYPVPMGVGDIQVSATGRTVLFNSAITVLTEGERVTAEGYLGDDIDPSEFALQSARSFGESLDEFEKDSQITPAGIFRSLHGLVDLVTVCQLWRQYGFDAPVLDDLSRLPVRQLPPMEAAPYFYSGINVTFVSGASGLTLSGGMLAQVSATRRSFHRERDAVMTLLEHETENAKRDNSLTRLLDLHFMLPQAGAGSDTQITQFAVGVAALNNGNATKARDIFLAVTQNDPFDADAWAKLAQAQFALGQTDAARSAIDNATRIEPTELIFKKVALEIDARTHPQANLATYEPDALKELSLDYSERARAQRIAGFKPEATYSANFAIRLWSDNADAYFQQAFLLRSPENVLRQFDLAIAKYRGPFAEVQGAASRQGLSQALSQRAFASAGFILGSPELANHEMVPTSLEDLNRGIRDLKEARALTPDDPVPYVFEANLQDLHALISRFNNIPASFDEALATANAAVMRFPGFALGHFMKAGILIHDRRNQEALTEFSLAIAHDSTLAQAYMERAKAHAALGNCSAAKDDVSHGHNASTREPVADPVLEGCN